MANKIYLFSSDGYRQSIELSRYATSIDGIKRLAKEHMKMLECDIVPHSFRVDGEIQKITFRYVDIGSSDEKEGSCYYMILEPI